VFFEYDVTRGQTSKPAPLVAQDRVVVVVSSGAFGLG